MSHLNPLKSRPVLLLMFLDDLVDSFSWTLQVWLRTLQGEILVLRPGDAELFVQGPRRGDAQALRELDIGRLQVS